MPGDDQGVESFLSAAQRVLHRGGPAEVTFSAVAREAGVETAEVEACFAHHGDLLHELNLWCMQRRSDVIAAAVAPATSAEQAIDLYYRLIVDMPLGLMEEFRLSAHASQVLPEMRRSRSPEQLERYLTVGNGMIDALEGKLLDDWGDEMLPQGVHPRRVAFVAQLLAQGFLNIMGILQVSNQSLLHGEQNLVRVMCNMISAPPRMIRQLTALNEVSRELAAMQTEKALLERVPFMLTEAFDFDRCMLLMDAETGGLDIVAISWTEEDQQQLVGDLMRDRVLEPPPHLRRCVAENRTIFVADPETDPDWPAIQDEQAREIAHQLGWRSPTLFTPLRCYGKPVGLLMGHTHLRWRPMDANDIARVEAFAAMVGVALQNVRLLENLNALVEERTRELRDTQAQLVQSEKIASLGKLVAGVAHELNTPLAAVNSSRDSMSKGLDRIVNILEAEFPNANDNPKLARALEVVSRASDSVDAGAQRIDSIVTRLRSFARLDQADLQLASLDDCVRDALALMKPALESIDLVVQLGQTPAIRCYPAQLNQALLNVLSNAVESMSTGTIRVSTADEPNAVLASVKDEGCGIAPEHLDRVFDPGFTTRGVGVGAGLGLSIAYRIVRDHGGDVHIESTLGAGTLVTITLPKRAPGSGSV